MSKALSTEFIDIDQFVCRGPNMGEASFSFSVQLRLPTDSTLEEKEEAASRLRREILETDAMSVECITDFPVPSGNKGLPIGVDGLLVTLAGSGSVLGAAIGAIANWSSNHNKNGSVTIKYNGNEFIFANPTSDEQHALVAACVAKLSAEKD